MAVCQICKCTPKCWL